ncbi:hypothetical protein METBIDRAFT_10558 [Metschnikowia bicuspidata var. bicuspidata NRRL YB-4993]|uniref:Endonuclease/exonuclease/phosphatase domain-containing protein n=1 Tax=Metschnikowia bicuspidata var. bicuspidata NRRL YB-4993 TaxID=869754 RepID=A0A1A0HKT5_9ASCO|nr:hypothetical protein METBIDRAFT_10558 [Metschnikowia bicuspidata var. bicuspidata NRRL YB-4993]OBA24418.1 hypothetical protein METBIDRAFT_10558 [Metschnikowia bicuspidata var. bicuspidata NRRL YB-4993]
MKQALVLIKKTENFSEYIRFQTEPRFLFYTFICGDFNSRQFDPVFSPAKLPCPLKEQYGKAASKVPYEAFMETRNDLINSHQRVYDKLISLYSIAYDLADRGISLTEIWSFIDYIFVLQDNKISQSPGIDALEEFAKVSNIKVLALLRVPKKSEIGKSRLSQPAVGTCPSDHVCLMADLELL